MICRLNIPICFSSFPPISCCIYVRHLVIVYIGDHVRLLLCMGEVYLLVVAIVAIIDDIIIAHELFLDSLVDSVVDS